MICLSSFLWFSYLLSSDILIVYAHLLIFFFVIFLFSFVWSSCLLYCNLLVFFCVIFLSSFMCFSYLLSCDFLIFFLAIFLSSLLWSSFWWCSYLLSCDLHIFLVIFVFLFSCDLPIFWSWYLLSFSSSNQLNGNASWLTTSIVVGEANRLVSWLIKHSRSTQVMHSIISHGALPHIVNMVTAEHAVMQNEALVALTFISAAVLGSDLNELLFFLVIYLFHL